MARPPNPCDGHDEPASADELDLDDFPDELDPANELDGEALASKERKRAGLPEMSPDCLPSSFAMKTMRLSQIMPN